MTTVLNSILFGIINQPQIWVRQLANESDGDGNPGAEEDRKVDVRVRGGSSGAVYGLGIIGACVYYIGHGTTAQGKLRGILKALVWPAILVYEMLQFLHKE